MRVHENMRELAALSAAGLLDAADERRVREHLRECPDCALCADEFSRLSAALTALPAPLPPAGLAFRTEARMAAELAADSDRHRGLMLAAAASLIAWAMALATWYGYRLLAGDEVLGWLALSTIPASLTGAIAAAMLRPRRDLRRRLS